MIGVSEIRAPEKSVLGEGELVKWGGSGEGSCDG